MSTFINSGITKGGQTLIAKNYFGQKLKFTRIVMGDGYMPQGTSPREMTDVVHAVANIPISKMRLNADGTVIIGGVFTNADISTEFFYRELALFAEGEDKTEVLYCYGNAGEFAERITPVGGSSIIHKTIDIITAIGIAENVTATIVQPMNGDEIGYNDSKTKLGVGSLQEAIEMLAEKLERKIAAIVISYTEPAEDCEIWLQPTGQSIILPDMPEGNDDPEDPDAPAPNAQPLFFYLAHYYDKENKNFIPFMYTNAAQNVFMTPGGTESVADVISQLRSGQTYTASELYEHISNADAHVTTEQLDNVFTAILENRLNPLETEIALTKQCVNELQSGISGASEQTVALMAANEALKAEVVALKIMKTRKKWGVLS